MIKVDPSGVKKKMENLLFFQYLMSVINYNMNEPFLR